MKYRFIIISFCLLALESCSGSYHSLSYFKSHLDEIEPLDSDSIVTIRNGKVMLSKEEGESGDYINFHLQYYKNNKLQYYKRVSKFFNSICYDGVLVESEEYESGVVAQELQKGYKFHDTVLRHSMVAVAQ